MAPTSTMTTEAAALRHYLDAQRTSALAILDGLTEEQLRTSVLPSGWTPLGLIKHLGYAERHWFQTVFRGTPTEVPWPDDDGEALTAEHPVAEVFAFYREQCERANAILATTPLDAKPVGRHGSGRGDDEVSDLRGIVLHMIEETARHLGHLDAARELIDGRTGLGPR
ncbi:DinB family protein [Microbispora sp. NPDC049125]|uniref:DinB family protein n=1 Tax=Microbispora sp. NPDC049125 TaxID=3154929 RepID=UPI003464F656